MHKWVVGKLSTLTLLPLENTIQCMCVSVSVCGIHSRIDKILSIESELYHDLHQSTLYKMHRMKCFKHNTQHTVA